MHAIRILHLEDNLCDAELVEAELASMETEIALTHVATRDDYLAFLEQNEVDLVLSDHDLPHFNGTQALKLLRDRDTQTPFIFVTGSLGEEKAIETIRSGATDYVLKHRLERLKPAVNRALQEANDRRARRIAEERIAEQAELLDLAPDAIMTCSLTGLIQFWSSGAERLYGWDEPQTIGRSIAELLHEENDVFEEIRRQTIEKGRWSGEARHQTKDGRKVIVSSRWTVLWTDNQQPKSILIINTDITEKKELEEQFLRSQRLESIGALAGGIAHDLNNVLAPIMMGIQLLKSNTNLAGEHNLLNTMETTAQRGAGMVKQILSFARGSHDEKRLVQLNHLIADIATIAKNTFPASIQVRRKLASNLWPTKIDATQIYQVLMNLCVNARDAMPSGGVLQVTSENAMISEGDSRLGNGIMPGAFTVIAVQDTGTGIPPEIRDKIFDAFFTTKEPGKGTGLGLSTSLGIIKNHAGFLTVETELGKGTTFKVFLPSTVEETVQDFHKESLEAYRGKGECILLIDDEQSIRRITKETLENFGFEVITAQDGTEALASFAQNIGKIQAVITDMEMPFLDGSATILALRNMKSSIKVLAVSGTQKLSDNDLIRMKPISFLQKPYSTQALLAELHHLLQSTA